MELMPMEKPGQTEMGGKLGTAHSNTNLQVKTGDGPHVD
jgi:hypothetical protein